MTHGPRPIAGPEGKRVIVQIWDGKNDEIEWLLLLDWNDGSSTWQEQLWSGGIWPELAKRLHDCEAEGRYITRAAVGGHGEWFVAAQYRDGSDPCKWWGGRTPYEFDDRMKLKGNDPTRIVAFGGDSYDCCWVAIEGANGFLHSNLGDDSDLEKRINRINRQRKTIHGISLSHRSSGAFFISDDDGAAWDGLGKYLSSELSKYPESSVYQVSECSSGEWIIIWEDSFGGSRGIPSRLSEALSGFFEEQSAYRTEREAAIIAYRSKREKEEQARTRKKEQQKRRRQTKEERGRSELRQKDDKDLFLEANAAHRAANCATAARLCARRHGYQEIDPCGEKHVLNFVSKCGSADHGIWQIYIYYSAQTVVTKFLTMDKVFSPAFRRMASAKCLDEIFASPCLTGCVCTKQFSQSEQTIPKRGQNVFVWGFAPAIVESDGILQDGLRRGRILVRYFDDNAFHLVEVGQICMLCDVTNHVELICRSLLLPGQDQQMLFAHLVLVEQAKATTDPAGKLSVHHVFLGSSSKAGMYVDNQTPKIKGFFDDSSALAAGLGLGDLIVSVKFPVIDWNHFCAATPPSEGNHVILGLVRAGQPVDVVVVVDNQYLLDMNCCPDKFPMISPNGERSKARGLLPGDRVATMTVPVISSEHLACIKTRLPAGTVLTITVLRSESNKEHELRDQEQVLTATPSLESTRSVFIRPTELHFTQATIKGELMDGRTLQQTVLELAREDISKRDIEMIKVVEHAEDGKLYSFDNRRLAVFRLLELAGFATKIKARVVAKPEAEWRRKKDTQNGGVGVRVQGPQRFEIGQSATTTSFPLEPILQAWGKNAKTNAAHLCVGPRYVHASQVSDDADDEIISLMEAMEGMESDDDPLHSGEEKDK